MKLHPLNQLGLALFGAAILIPQEVSAQAGSYAIDPQYLNAHLDIAGNPIYNWDYSDVTLVINNDLTAYLEGNITTPGLADTYYIRFDYVDPYQTGNLYEPDLLWGDFTGSMKNLTTGNIVERYEDYNGSGRFWGNNFDAAFGIKRAEQGGNHPAPWTNGTAPNGSLEFGMWISNSQGQRNGDLNTTLTAVPEASSALLGMLSGMGLLLRRRRN
jgi:hypothetical protein